MEYGVRPLTTIQYSKYSLNIQSFFKKECSEKTCKFETQVSINYLVSFTIIQHLYQLSLATCKGDREDWECQPLTRTNHK